MFTCINININTVKIMQSEHSLYVYVSLVRTEMFIYLVGRRSRPKDEPFRETVSI